MNSGQLFGYNRQSAITGGTFIMVNMVTTLIPERDKLLWLI